MRLESKDRWSVMNHSPLGNNTLTNCCSIGSILFKHSLYHSFSIPSHSQSITVIVSVYTLFTPSVYRLRLLLFTYTLVYIYKGPHYLARNLSEYITD